MIKVHDFPLLLLEPFCFCYFTVKCFALCGLNATFLLHSELENTGKP